MIERQELYDIAKAICHEYGLPWTDPRTGQTHEPTYYLYETDIGEHGHCGIFRFLFTSAIISGISPGGYEDRWCYTTLNDAVGALAVWKLHPEWPEPEGWHRHPDSGRRRPDGDKAREYVDP
jgi:hypothetical protein